MANIFEFRSHGDYQRRWRESVPAEVESVLLQMNNIRDVTVECKLNPSDRYGSGIVNLVEPEEKKLHRTDAGVL